MFAGYGAKIVFLVMFQTPECIIYEDMFINEIFKVPAVLSIRTVVKPVVWQHLEHSSSNLSQSAGTLTASLSKYYLLLQQTLFLPFVLSLLSTQF